MSEEKNVTELKSLFKRKYTPHRRCCIRICENCGKVYVMSDSDIIYFAKTYEQLPLRCPDCRAKRRMETTETTETTE